ARRSASCHIHVKVILKEEVDFWESIYLRALWNDDANRIRMDIIRWWNDRSVQRLWDVKVDFKDGKSIILEAGPWIRV
ncbi:MAG: hypothetical protein ACP5IE_06780, partial [Infirmifilum sp.]